MQNERRRVRKQAILENNAVIIDQITMKDIEIQKQQQLLIKEKEELRLNQ